MITRVVIVAGVLAALLLGKAAADAQPRSAGPPNGALLLIGGGVNTPSIIQAAQRLAGGAHARWVVIPTAGSDSEIAAFKPPAFIRQSATSFVILHTRDRTKADSEDFVAPLRLATAVWLAGGRQWAFA